MWLPYSIPCLVIAAGLVAAAQDASTVKLTISADIAASLEVDGKDAGLIQPGAPFQLNVTPGEHEVVATPRVGGPPYRKIVSISSALPAELSLPLRVHRERVEVETQGFWKDARTGLLWTATDNGSGVSVSQAHSYCQRLRAGGFSDWRLPSIEELQPLFGGSSDERGFRVVAPLKLSGWCWSATQGNEPAENWTIDFGDGARASVAAGDGGLNRALCVRSAVEPRRAQ